MDTEKSRVSISDAAAKVVRQLKNTHGDLMFHQSGGCCDGSAPMCYPAGEFRVGNSDHLLGEIEGCPFYISESQYERWKHTHLTVDVVEGRGLWFFFRSSRGDKISDTKQTA